MNSTSVQKILLSEANDINRHSDWNVDFRQIEPGPMQAEVAVRQGEHVALLEITMDRAVHQTGQSPSGWVTLGLPHPSALRAWRGKKVEAPWLLNFGTATEFDCVSDPGFTGLTISVSEPFLVRIADRIGLPFCDELERRRALPIRQRSASISQSAAIGQRLLQDGGIRFDTPAQEDFVAGLISATLEAPDFDDQCMPSTRAKSVQRAIDFMANSAQDPISVGGICAATGVSWRTLDRGFREQFGIGPKAYLNRLRLGRVRSELLLQGAEIGVTDAANAWGFWHMGQFAKDYRRMFGELPSGTLSRLS